mgnify:CR=1 FL=1
MELTQAEALRLFKYDPETGIVTRRVRVNNQRAGDVVGNHARGYLVTRRRDRTYGLHRLIWLMVYGELPTHEIDHINGVRDDNRLVNLRSVTRTENMQNKKKYNTNTSGQVGVSWVRHLDKWQARISINGNRISLGCFTNLTDAIIARYAAEEKYGYCENHGRL